MHKLSLINSPNFSRILTQKRPPKGLPWKSRLHFLKMLPASEGHETLNKLIQEKVTSSTAALKREIKNLRSQLKGPRGANTTPGAPSPKKPPSPRTQRTPSQPSTKNPMQRSPRRRTSSPRSQRRPKGNQGPIDTHNPRRGTPNKPRSPRRNAPPDGTNNAARTDNKTRSPSIRNSRNN